MNYVQIGRPADVGRDYNGVGFDQQRAGATLEGVTT
jgi:hypothetical protein